MEDLSDEAERGLYKLGRWGVNHEVRQFPDRPVGIIQPNTFRARALSTSMKRAAFLGFLIWLGATIGLRLAGQHVFALHPLLLLGVSAPLMALIAWVIARTPGEAIALVAPGMLLDPFSAIWFADVFPNIRADAAGLFGGWLLFCNVVVLLTALARQTRPSTVHSPGLSREP